ncbi:hypothetical protein [Sphingomicrobium sediminis]|uniref:Uncharacterized protein n=1 Tax=Sphingomicrobium sediminis TaxID=2950949 RepID=A0A9X2EGE2_9SPHN|nr:hypothetical protein [Sphingomicrobium sediminis]MCM8557002.1 hypothetical protein [Sphingomicrobium sediminis]
MNKFFVAIAAGSLAAVVPAGSAIAAQPAGISQGMPIVTGESTVGIVDKVEDGYVYVKTDKYVVPYPTSSFTPHEGMLLFSLTMEQINTAHEQAQAELAAKAEASVAVGAPVKAVDMTVVGTIDEITADYIQIEMNSGKVSRIPPNGIQKDPNGAIALYQVADLQAIAVDRPEEPVEEAVEGDVAAEAAVDVEAEAAEGASIQ